MWLATRNSENIKSRGAVTQADAGPRALGSTRKQNSPLGDRTLARSAWRKTGSALPRGCFWPLESETLLFQGEHPGPGKKGRWGAAGTAEEEGGESCRALPSRHKGEVSRASSCHQSPCLHRRHRSVFCSRSPSDNCQASAPAPGLLLLLPTTPRA